MDTFFIILLLAGVICFLLATFNVPVKFNLVALGLALVFLVPLISRIRASD